MKKAFTLAETLIVLFIIGILTTILIKSYLSMSDISFRVEQEKSVTQEIIFVSETLQNLADTHSVDYDKYNLEELIEQNGVTDVLYLTGESGELSIFSSGSECLDPGIEYDVLNYLQSNQDLPNCSLVVQKGQTIIPLSNPKKAYFSRALFKVIPYAPAEHYYNNPQDCNNFLSCLHHPGVWLMMKAYSVNYGTRRSNRVSLPVQQFFNLQ